jgi:hypothetical protein
VETDDEITLGRELVAMIYDNANAIMRFWVSLNPVYSCMCADMVPSR